MLDQFDQSGGDQIVVVHGFWIIADVGRIAHHHKDIAHAQGVGGEQIPLHPEKVAAAGWEVEHALNLDLPLDALTDGPRAHAHAGHWAVGDIDDVRAGLGQQPGARQDLVG